MPHKRRRTIHHASTSYRVVPRAAASRREQSEAFGQLQSSLLFERAFRPHFMEDVEQRQTLIDLALELGVTYSEHNLSMVSTAALYERVKHEVAEGRVLLAPLLGGGSAQFGGLGSTHTEEELRAGEEELALLRRTYGVLLNANGKLAYTYRAQGRWCYRVEEYLTHRDAYLGAGEAYFTYKEQGQSELDAKNAALREVIEPSTKTRPDKPDWQAAQDVFYAWVRRGYHNKFGLAVDVPALIRARMSPVLRYVLQSVRVDSGVEFQCGGFNPRPMKQGGYRLGTISDHAFGTAIDIEDSKNAQVKPWARIESYTGLKLDRGTRRLLWQSSPLELHRRITESSRKFVQKIAQAVEAQGSLDEVIKADRDLASMREFVHKWHQGFFSLPWPVVRECHSHSLVWGATFTTPDLHHFELPSNMAQSI